MKHARTRGAGADPIWSVLRRLPQKDSSGRESACV